MAPEVSIVVLNFNGKRFLDPCLESLTKQSFPSSSTEILFVDNASSDGSVDHVRAHWPSVRVVELRTNLGFAAGINAGVKASTGKFVALINNDAVAEPDWVTKGLEGFNKGSDVGMVASKILTMDGKTIDYAGGALSFYGHGYKVGVNEPDEGQFDRPAETLFASGCALFMQRQLFLETGGFDEDYFAFFEDVDLGWRLWIMGYRVLYEPSSVVRHHHHGTANHLGQERELFLLERNALMTIMKNYEQANLDNLLPASIMLALERGLTYSGIDRENYNLALKHEPLSGEDERVSPLAMAHVLAVSEVTRNVDSIMKKRAAVQKKRLRSDKELAPLFISPLHPNISDPGFQQTFGKVVESLTTTELFSGPTKVLVITGDTVSTRMAGPAIRAWEMSTELSRKHKVRLLANEGADINSKNFELGVLRDSTLQADLDWADVVVFQGFIMHAHPRIARSGKILVADLYDPFHLENLEMFREDDPDKRFSIAGSDLEVINSQLKLCDFFICASEKQRDFWIGQLAGVGRLGPEVYDADPTLRSLLDIVPFGISSDQPLHSENVLKGVVPGIGKNDKVILWGGGIYNWFDPLTLIKAIDQVKNDHPEVKLFFLGMTHPNPDVPEMRMAVAAVKLARQLGLEGTHVFFNSGWIPYEKRANYLLESDIGVSCHLEHIETTYSYRTRVLDYFWAELPVIVTRGDSLSQLVEEHSLGLTVGPGDVEGFASAIRRILEDEELSRESRLNVGKLRPELSWSQIIGPLDRFCSTPRHAADNLETRPIAIQRPFSRLSARAALAWHEGGLTLVAVRARDFLTRLLKLRR
ncbi:MAG: glycosyltransferase [Actinomycetota bacterium]